MNDPVLNRYAVRKYADKKIDEQDVQKLIDAFQAAPCGMHQMDVMQGIVVEDNQLRNEVETATKNACYDAPLLFILITKKDSPFGERDSSVAAENIMIEAASLGLGSVYVMGGALSLNTHPDVLKELGVPEDFMVSTIVPVGYSVEDGQREDRSHRYQISRK